ncbi:MAG: YhgE/Pip family protein [Longibaculum sp.]
MVKQEWKNIFHNAWIMIVVVAIIAIPSIYACVFLGSMWDPYGNTGCIPVAVVNEDKEVTYNEKSLAVGEELVKNLKDNDSMEFHFVNGEDAQKGLEKGDYYMTITIPQDFSKNATTLLDDNPQKMILNYTTNPGTNYIASKMDDSAIAKIKAEVSSSVTKTYAETIFEQIGTLSDGLGEASDGTTKLSDGVNQLVDGNKTISDNLQVLASSSLTFKDGASTLTKGLKDYTDGVVTVNNGVYTIKNGLDTLNNSTGALATGVDQLNTGASTLANGIHQYTSGVSVLYAGTQGLVSSNQKLNDGMTKLSEGTQNLVDGNQKVSEGIKSLSKKVSSTQDKLNKYQTLISTLQNSGNPSYMTLANTITTNGLQLDSLDSHTKALLANYGVTEDLPSYSQLIKEVSEGMSQLNTAINTQLLPGTEQVQTGLEEVNKKVNKGDESLVKGIQTYTAGVSQVNEGLSQLTDKNKELVGGSRDLANGTKQIKKETPTLISGVKALDTGASELYKGTSQLVSNNKTLLGGAGQLGDGASQISSGAGQLAAGSSTLGSGLNEVKNGVQTLDSSLKDGAKQSQLSTNDDTFEMMAAPVDTNHKEISVVENNGHAMAPYMMSVALYVCGLAFTLMYPMRRGIKEAENGWKYWLSKATVMYTVSTVAAVVMISCLRFINGFEPQQMMMTYLFAIIVSAAFMSIIALLNLTTGFIGEFLLLVFMIINLGGSAGTYPIETSSGFFKAIHYLVPYTYSVDGFRKVISMATASLSTEIWVFIGIFIVCSILTICYYQFKNKEDKHIIPQAFEKVNEEE